MIIFPFVFLFIALVWYASKGATTWWGKGTKDIYVESDDTFESEVVAECYKSNKPVYGNRDTGEIKELE